MVIIATPWDGAATIAQEHKVALEGKIVVSMANALVRVGHGGVWLRTFKPPSRSVALWLRFTTYPPPSLATSASQLIVMY